LLVPPIEAAVEDRNAVMTVILERPPETGGKVTARVIDRHHVGVAVDASLAHRRGELDRGGDLGLHLMLRIDDVDSPVDEDRTWNMSREVFIASADILRVLTTAAEILGLDVAANVYDSELWMTQVLGEPSDTDKTSGKDRIGHSMLLKRVSNTVASGQFAQSLLVDSG